MSRQGNARQDQRDEREAEGYDYGDEDSLGREADARGCLFWVIRWEGRITYAGNWPQLASAADEMALKEKGDFLSTGRERKKSLRLTNIKRNIDAIRNKPVQNTTGHHQRD
jgi:hypothetical protein